MLLDIYETCTSQNHRFKVCCSDLSSCALKRLHNTIDLIAAVPSRVKIEHSLSKAIYICHCNSHIRHRTVHIDTASELEVPIELHASLGHVPRSKTNPGITVNP